MINERFCQLIRATDFTDLQLSRHHQQYLGTLLRSLPYYADIFTKCFTVIGDDTPPKSMVCVDYGGGCGLLSIFAKLSGIGKVIYIDISSSSVEAAGNIFRKVGCGADIVLHGDVSTLQNWCKTNGIKPTHLISTDVIEHIYDLTVFFRTLREINPEMRMVFTTASVADNPIKRYSLHKIMKRCERRYLTQRLEYIQNKFPAIDHSQAVSYAKVTRGLIYEEIDAVIRGELTPPTIDRYNTCDPETGNWIERILTIEQYRQVVKPLTITCHRGFYNEYQQLFVKKRAAKLLNSIIQKCDKAGATFSPFIILYITQ